MHDETRKAYVAWLKRAVAAYPGSATALARASELAPSTILKPLNNPDWHGNPNTTTIAKIAAVAGIRPPSWAGLEQMGMAEREVEPYDPEANKGEKPSGKQAGRDTWVVNTDILSQSGICRGDHIVVDLNTNARTGDRVLAQVYDDTGGAETVLRVYDRPFLTARCPNPPKPLLVDDEKVVILGVVVERHWYRECA